MNVPLRTLAFVTCAAVALATASSALAHARVSPPVALSKSLQLFTLTVPTEKEGVTTTKIVFTRPAGFSIDSFVPTPGWQRHVQQTGSGASAVINSVTWTGGAVPTGEDATFQFLAEPQSSKTYTFGVEQTHSDGSIDNWSGAESSDAPAPTIEAKSSLGGGGGGSTLALVALVALVAGAVGILLGGFALVSKSGRPLA